MIPYPVKESVLVSGNYFSLKTTICNVNGDN